MTQTMTLESVTAEFPVCQSSRTGKFGWRRVAGSLNLNACGFSTEAEAVADRNRVLADRRNWTDLSR